MADLAKLTVALEAEIGRYQKNLNKANKQLNRFQRNTNSSLRKVEQRFQKMGQGVGRMLGTLGVALGGFQLGRLVKDSFATADAVQKMSQRLGISTEALSRLQFAAEQTGVPVRSLEMGLQRMTRRVSEAAQGTGEARGALKELGVDAKALAQLAPEDQFALLADAMEKVDNQGDRVRLAMKLFDSEGVALIQTMRGGSAAINEFGRQADDLNITLSQEQVDAAAKANDAMNRLSKAFTGAANSIIVDLGPQLERLADFLTTSVPKSVMATVRTFGALEAAMLQTFERIIGTLGVVADRLASLIETFESLPTIVRALPIFAGANALSAALDSEALRKFAADSELATREIRKDVDDLVESAGRVGNLEFTPKEPPKPRDFSGAVPGADALAEQERRQRENERRANEAARRQNALMQEAATVFESTRTPVERFNAEIARLNRLRDTFVDGKPLINEETFARAVAMAQEELESATDSAEQFGQTIEAMADQAARNIQDSFADFLFDPFDKGLKGMLDSFVNTLQRMAAEMAAAQIFEGLAGAFGGSAAGNILGDFFGGARAMGGPVSTGKAFLVGERGPELFIPDTAGRIEPNTGEISISMPVTINGGMPDQQSLTELQTSVGLSIQRALGRNS